LYEPIPGYDLLGEVRALDDIARDFLLRDGETSTAASRPTRVVGLKPKRTTASSAFRWVKFALERAEVAFDAETLFPLRIAFVPARDSGAAPLLGPDATVTVESSDVRRLDPDDDAAPALPADARVFEEVEFPIPQLTEVAPFRVPVDAARSMGYELVGDSARLVLDAARERGYATLLLAKPDERGRAEGVVTLRVGNYLSRWMARRRTLATERGERVDESGVRANYLDRRTLWKASEGAEGLPALADLVWEKDGIFHVIAAEGVTREDLIALGAALTSRRTLAASETLRASGAALRPAGLGRAGRRTLRRRSAQREEEPLRVVHETRDPLRLLFHGRRERAMAQHERGVT